MRATVVTYLVVFLCIATTASAQTDIYGFFQNQFKYATYTDETIFSEYSGISNPSDDRTSFAMQQLNVMLRHQLTDDFVSFVNVELTNSFSTERNTGQLNLEEAWLMYTSSRAFKVKGGMLIPTFNQLNTQKNKTPLLPWTIRPLVYETSLNSAINSEPLLPLTAFFEASGVLDVSDDVEFEYAFHVGNSGNLYKGDNDPESQSITRSDGPDSTTYMEFGGRVGFNVDNLKVGVSVTTDHQPIYELDNDNPFVDLPYILDTIPDSDEAPVYSLGNVQRMRIGADLSYSIAGFTLLGEFILATYSMDADQEAALDAWYQQNIVSTEIQLPDTHPAYDQHEALKGTEWANNDLDRLTYFVSLVYDINEQWYVAGMYSFFQNKSFYATKEGITGLSFDVGYKPIDIVTLRLSYAQFEVLEVPTWPLGGYNGQWFMLTSSVVF